jgi:DNA-binding transcriptional regulator PaaX
VIVSEQKKYQREATKQLLKDLLKTASGLTILMSRPSGSMWNTSPFMGAQGFDKRKFQSTIRHMKNYGYIAIKEKKDEITITLLEAGHKKALKYSIDDIKIDKPAVWDKKWRLVMFDIPEENRLARAVFKEKLDELGFALLQKSVYIYPYPCHNELDYIRTLYNIAGFVKLLVVDKIEDEEQLRKRFDL